jgi:hypothetical protein
MNLDLLSGTFDIQENPGLDTFDPRFADIMALVEDVKYADAAVQSQAVIEEKIYDIRIISYFLFGTFIEEGVTALNPILEALTNVLDENLEAIGPAKKREKGVANSLKWLFAQLIKKIEYEEKKNEDLWQLWLKADSDAVNQASEACQKLQKVLGRTLEDLAGPVVEIINKLKSWLDQFYQMVYKEPEAVEAEEELAEEPANNATQQAAQEPSSQGSIPGSYHMQQLSIKFMTFQMLLKKQKYSLAAIVSDNINKLIAEFNPKIHLPQLFSPYMQTYATNVNELSENDNLKNTFEWQSLKELYKVDLQSFLNFNEQISFSTPYTPPSVTLKDLNISSVSNPQDSSYSEDTSNIESFADTTEQSPEASSDDSWTNSDDVW